MEPSLEATNHYTNPLAWTFTNGAHLAPVEVDVETGEVRLLSYAVVEDCGRIINPAIVDGQVRGGGVPGASEGPCMRSVYTTGPASSSPPRSWTTWCPPRRRCRTSG